MSIKNRQKPLIEPDQRPEAEIKSAILEFLNTRPDTFAFCVRVVGIPIISPAGNFCGFRKTHSEGISDIIGMKQGRFFAMEVKTPDGKVTQEQLDFLERVNRRGRGYECIVRSLEDAMQAWGEI